MLFSYGYGRWWNRWWRSNAPPSNLVWRPHWSAGAMPLTSTNGGGPGLHLKPMDATIGQVFAPYCPGGHQGCRQNNDDGKIPAVCWPFRWPWRCADTVPRASPDRGGPGLLRKQLVTDTGQVLRPIVSIGHAKADVFIVDLLKRGLRWCQGP